MPLPSRIVTDCGPLLGEWVERPKRIKRPDNAKGRAIDRYDELADGLRPQDLPLAKGQRAVFDPDEYKLQLLRAEVNECLAAGFRLRMRWRVELREGRVLTIPDKGKVTRWASVEDLVQALAQGVPF